LNIHVFLRWARSQVGYLLISQQVYRISALAGKRQTMTLSKAFQIYSCNSFKHLNDSDALFINKCLPLLPQTIYCLELFNSRMCCQVLQHLLSQIVLGSNLNNWGFQQLYVERSDSSLSEANCKQSCSKMDKMSK